MDVAICPGNINNEHFEHAVIYYLYVQRCKLCKIKCDNVAMWVSEKNSIFSQDVLL